MSATDPKAWIILARDDLRAAGTLAEHDRDWHNSTYHASQSVEKALKAPLKKALHGLMENITLRLSIPMARFFRWKTFPQIVQTPM